MSLEQFLASANLQNNKIDLENIQGGIQLVSQRVVVAQNALLDDCHDEPTRVKGLTPNPIWLPFPKYSNY